MAILLKIVSVRLVPFKSCKLESKTRAKVFGKVDTTETYQSSSLACSLIGVGVTGTYFCDELLSNKSLACTIVPVNGVLVILPIRHGSQDQMIHNQVIPKVHQNGVSSCALHQYDLNGSVIDMLQYHYQLCIFWHQYYEYVYHHDTSPSYLLLQTLLPLFWTLACMI